MRPEYIEIASHLLLALVVGSVIGLERTFNGRPAGFRTHALVCLASALLMVITSYQSLWLDSLPMETIRTDPSRMAQGIMTGIGFLGAGVIFKEGPSVRGLTTAASIWMTAAIGTLLGIGFYVPALLGAAITFGVLSLFRMVEEWMPTRHYARHMLRFRRENVPTEAELLDLLKRQGVEVAKINRRLLAGGTLFEYRMVVKTMDLRNFDRLNERLLEVPEVEEFHLDSIVDSGSSH